MKHTALKTLAAAIAAGMLSAQPAASESVLRIAMTAADVPTTTGMPNNGFEGMRFLGYPVFEPLIDWDLSSVDKPADLRPGLATSWEVDPEDPTKWIFKLRKGVKFHDGTTFDADDVIWNMERFWDKDSPQFEQAGAALTQARNPLVESWRKIDDYTVEITTKYPASYFPYFICLMLIASPDQFEAVGGDWNAYAKAPMGTGPFQITAVDPRVSVTLSKFDGYWNPDRVAKVDKVKLFPMPESTTRLAALRSGQVDWIEVPPPDAIPGLKGAGFEVVTNAYPHIWPYEFNMLEGSPFADKRVRQAANYAVDREGLVALLNGTAAPAKGLFAPGHPWFGKPKNDYTYDPEKAKALLAEAGYGPDNPVKAKIMISTSGSGQMMPIPMNEYIQQSLAQVGIDLDFEVVEWGTLLVALRNAPFTPPTMNSDALNVSLVTSDYAQFYRYFHSKNASPVSYNWGHFKNDEFDAILDKVEAQFDPESVNEVLPAAHEILVDEAPWLFIVHDLNPRAMSPKVKGFISAQSWFQDLTNVYIEE